MTRTGVGRAGQTDNFCCALKDDVRYADFKRDFLRNPTMDQPYEGSSLTWRLRVIVMILLYVGDPQLTPRLSKRAVDLTSSEKPVVDLPLQGGK